MALLEKAELYDIPQCLQPVPPPNLFAFNVRTPIIGYCRLIDAPLFAAGQKRSELYFNSKVVADEISSIQNLSTKHFIASLDISKRLIEQNIKQVRDYLVTKHMVHIKRTMWLSVESCTVNDVCNVQLH